jgi:hypothetical protein
MTATYQEFIEVTPLKGSRLKEQVGVPEALTVLKDGQKPSKFQHMFRIMTPKDGDKRVVWDSRDLAQIEEAKAMFDECVLKGLVPYRVGLDGRATSEVMDEFDPDAEEVIFLPIAAAVGG